MDTYKVIMSKLDIRQFDSKKVAAEVKSRVLEAARASGTGNNKQEWRFILVQEKEMLKRLAEDSTSGGWVAGANFAVVLASCPSRASSVPPMIRTEWMFFPRARLCSS